MAIEKNRVHGEGAERLASRNGTHEIASHKETVR